MPVFQKTISKEGEISGIGLHTGKSTSVILKPSAEDSGVRFFQDGHLIKPLLIEMDKSSSGESPRCSIVTDGKRSILTVEHLLAAIYGLGITNIDMDVQGPEIPALDGSALGFVKLFRKLKVRRQKKPAFIYEIREPIFLGEPSKSIAIYPSFGAQKLSVSYVMDYSHPYLSKQKVDFEVSPEVFEKEIAPARTFITEEEEAGIRERRLGLGGSAENTLIIRRDGAHKKKLRFRDECARHKVLDVIGDLAALGSPVSGHVVGLRSGHLLNRKLVLEIKKQRGEL